MNENEKDADWKLDSTRVEAALDSRQIAQP